MSFIIFCAVIAFMIQIIILYSIKGHYFVRLLALIVMELFPGCIAVHAFITKPGGILGWEFTIACCEWIAGAILLGYVLAWIIFVIERSRK